MSDRPLVSVIIPTFEHAPFLKRAIESVLWQTYPSVEMIVIDDGSTDATAQVAMAYQDRVQYVYQEHRGLSAARNHGLALARGQYINFLNDDDVFYPEKIALQVEALETTPQACLVHCRYEHVDPEGHLLSRIGPLPSGDVRAQLLRQRFVWPSAPLVRRTILDEIGNFDERLTLAGDYDLWLRLALTGSPFACVQRYLGASRIYPDGLASEIAMIEQEVVSILGRIFGDPALPANLQAQRQEVFAHWRFWLALHNYASEQWESARRNLEKAIEDNPSFATDRQALYNALIRQALDIRVRGAQRYIRGVFDHLPPALQKIVSDRDLLMAWTRVGLALQFVQRGKTDDAQTLFISAIADCPQILDHTDTIAHMVATTAMSMSSNPDVFVEVVFDQLPAHAVAWGQMRRRVRADVNIACAFEDYFAGNFRSVVRRVLKALAVRPWWLTNRGVISILGRSLWAALARK